MTKKTFSYKESIEEIETILAEIENQKLDVDELAGKVKKVTTLLTLCKNKLHATEEDVEKLLADIEHLK